MYQERTFDEFDLKYDISNVRYCKCEPDLCPVNQPKARGCLSYITIAAMDQRRGYY